MDEALESLFEPIFSQYADCTGLEFDLESPGFISTSYETLKDIIANMFGTPAFKLYDVYSALADLPEALAKALIGDFDDLNTIITEKLTVPLNTFNTIVTDTQAWFTENFLGFYDRIPVPLPECELDVGLFTIPLPSNAAYRNLPSDSIYLNFDPTTILNFITEIITSSLNLILSYINGILEPITAIVTLDLPNIGTAITDLVNYFIELAVPLVKIVNGYIDSIVSIFNLEDAENVVIELLEHILVLESDMSKIPTELQLVYKFLYCLINLLNTTLVALFTFEFV